MIKTQIDLLDQRLTSLMAYCRQLLEENRSLQLRLEHIAAERAHLIKKHDLARSRVEAMINRLKSMEQS
jgi:cell division protein ZapB